MHKFLSETSNNHLARKKQGTNGLSDELIKIPLNNILYIWNR